jgi:predicted nucleic acid-binding protein
VPPPYLADTNVYVRAANEPAFRVQFERFIRLHGPLVVSSVVVAEVLIGVAQVDRHEAILRGMVAGSRLLVPESEDWIASARVVGRLGGESITKSRSFWNDALLASQCSRLRATLVTSNSKDFRRLGRHLPITVQAPFP